MRVLAMLALALLLGGCEGDRTKHGNGSMNERQAQPQSHWISHLAKLSSASLADRRAALPSSLTRAAGVDDNRGTNRRESALPDPAAAASASMERPTSSDVRSVVANGGKAEVTRTSPN